MGTEPGRHEEPAHLALAEDELVVRRERLGAVYHPVDPGISDRRHAPDGPVHDLGEARPIRGEQLAVEIGWDPVKRPRRRMALVSTHAQPADFLAKVDQVVRIAQLWQARVNPLDRFGEQVLVGHRDDRHVDAHHPSDLRREHATGVDDDVGPDLLPLALVLDGDASHPPSCHVDTDDPRVRSDPRPALTGAGRKREGEARRVQPAIRRQVDRAEDTFGRHQREECSGVLRPDQFEREAERLGPAGLPSKLLVALRARRESQ